MLNLTYIQKGLLYSLPPEKKKDFSTTNFVHRLKDSLSNTLTHFHPLAGRLATVKQTNPPSVVIFINPENSPGARFIHASVNLTIDDLLTPTDVPLIVESFFDHHKTIGHDGHQKSLVSIQVTELVDGIFIEHYFGNAIQTFGIKTTVGELLDHGIGWAAMQLHELVVNHGDKQIREYVDSWVKKPIVHKMDVIYDGVGVHPLAGRLATVKLTNPPSVVIFINPENSPGARFIHASVNLTIDDLLTPTDVPLIVESFFDHHKTIGHDGHQKSLVSIQVTELVDGIFIGCSMSHTVADGTSFWHFFNSLSQVFQSKPIAPPVLKRWVPEGYDPIITLPFTHEDEYVNRPNPPLVRQRIFHLNSNAMAKLKAKVNSECNTTRISTLQSLLAVIWRCVIRARRFPAEKETSCKLPVNVRSRMSPPLPEHYFGNAIQIVGIKTTVGELLDHSIGWAAMQLHELVVNLGDKQIHFCIPFGREEFYLVTGLRFGVQNWAEYDTKERIPFRRRVFPSYLDGQPITSIDIANMIVDQSFTQLYDDDVVSLCCLGILQLVILGVESRRVVPD
nr:uncharacterized acetyltransferase At3g50280-like [Tanacetum cinerariifolium]